MVLPCLTIVIWYVQKQQAITTDAQGGIGDACVDKTKPSGVLSHMPAGNGTLSTAHWHPNHLRRNELAQGGDPAKGVVAILGLLKRGEAMAL